MNNQDKSKLEILVIDDEQVVLDMLKNLLETAGYGVLLAKDGKTAVRLLEQRKPPVAIVDKNLPDISGLDLIAAQKKKHPNIRFIMITAYSSLDSATQALRVGAFSYMTKPFNEIEDVLKRVQSALAAHSVETKE